MHRTSGGTMPAKNIVAASRDDVTMLSLDAFKGQFNITSLIDKIALPVLDQARQNKTTALKSGSERSKEGVHDSLRITEQLLQQFDR